MRSSIWSARSTGGCLGLALLAAACTDTETVFVERPFFDDPPAAAAGFLGYGNQAAQLAKLTVCGNCHVGRQSEWQTTAHADAWEGLQASGHAQPFCEGCHTVNQRGNETTADGGWISTGDPRYYDVQCESCHGPGETHVSNPDATQPLASLDLGAAVDEGCAECHSGDHHPFAEEWSNSKHAQVVDFAAAREECAPCHRGQGALSAWGVKGDYKEKFASEHLPIVCGVCHDPHGGPNAGQLRFPVETVAFEEHLCARCHDRRTAPDPNSSHGLAPHAPETALLQGTAGWFPPDAPIDEGQIRATHGTERNPTLCANCHVDMFTVTDAVTGEFLFEATGHLFTALPCVDANGIPVPGDCEFTTEARSFNGCTGAGGGTCHSEVGALSALTLASTRIVARGNELLSQLEIVDPNLDGPGGEIDATDGIFTVAEGGFFNLNLATFPEEGVAATMDNVAGSAVHNPFLTEGLLIASIAAVEGFYGVSPTASAVRDWWRELREFLDRVPR